MYDVRNFDLSDMTACGSVLRRLGKNARCMEDAATDIVRHLYENLVDGETGVRAMALVRFFKTHPYLDLDPELRGFADMILGDTPVPPEMKCLPLLASAGEEPEWNSRHNSNDHKAIPLPSEELVHQFPMISNLVKQFGLEINAFISPDPSCLADLEQTTYNVFCVPQTPGSPYVPAQESFVFPYGIQSTLGFGGVLPSGNLFAVIMFSKVPVSFETADLFKPLALSTKLAILPFDNVVFREKAKVCS